MEEVIISIMPEMRLIGQLVFTLLNPLGVANGHGHPQKELPMYWSQDIFVVVINNTTQKGNS